MTTIQDRIINSFDKKFFFKTGKLKGFFKPSIDGSNIKQFIVQSIKLVQEETRKELLKHLPPDYVIYFIVDKLNKSMENNVVGEDHFRHIDFIGRLITLLKLDGRKEIAEELTKKHEDEALFLMYGENYKSITNKEKQNG